MLIIKYIFILFIIFVSSKLHSQANNYIILKSPPSYTIQFNVSYNQSIYELMGAYNDDYQSSLVYDGQSFGADKGYGASIISKINLTSNGRIRFTQSLNFNRISTYTFGEKTNIADKGMSNYNCFTGGLGLEYIYRSNSKHRFNFYIGAELNLSLISGEIKVWFANASNPPPSDTTYKILNSLRGGFGLSVGSEYFVSDNFGIHLGARLINANLVGKQAEGSNSDREFKLRDAANTNLKFAGEKSKNFSFLNVMAGVNFYFGVKTKKYIK